MNALIDANVIIAAFLDEADRTPASKQILLSFKEGRIQHLFTTSYVMVEVISFLLRRGTFQQAHDAYLFFTKTERLSLEYIGSSYEFSIRDMFQKFKSLTLTDCSLVVIGEEKGINTLYSFDSGFDKVKGIMRLEK